MNRYYNEFLEGIGQRASQNDGIVEMNEWFHNLSFDVLSPQYNRSHDVIRFPAH